MPTFETAFLGSGSIQYNGCILRRKDTLGVGKISRVVIRRLYTNSKWRQGIALSTDGSFLAGQEPFVNKIALWEDAAPSEVVIDIRSRNEVLSVYNIWDEGNGVMLWWGGGAAMVVEDSAYGARYHCNDGHPDDNCDDIVFDVTIAYGRGGEPTPLPKYRIDGPRSPLTGESTIGRYTALDFARDADDVTQREKVRQAKRQQALQACSACALCDGERMWLQERGFVDPFAMDVDLKRAS